MKKIFIIISLLLFLSSCWEIDDKVVKYYETSIVSTWSLDKNTTYVWYTDSFDSIWLSFKSPWKITAIYKWIGDRVVEWELLAELDWLEAKTWYSSSLDIIASLNNLKQSTSLSYDKQIEATRAQINQLNKALEMSDISISWAQSWLSDADTIKSNQIETIENQISQAELWLETSKINYDNTKSLLEKKETDIYTNSKNSISSANTLSSNVFDFLDTLFGVSSVNKNKNDSFEIYLWARNSSQKISTENLIDNWMKDFSNLKEKYSNLDSNEKIKEALNEYYIFFNNDLKNILASAYTTLENSIESSNFSSSQINQYKSTISEFQSKNEQVILFVSWNFMLGLKWSLDNIDTIQREKKSSLDLLQKQIENSEKQIDILKKSLETYKSQSSWNVNQASTWLEQAKKQKEIVENQIIEANAWLEALIEKKNASLSEIDTQISQARASQNNAWAMIQNTKIYSNISGIITKKMFDVWEVVWAWIPVLYVSNSKDIKIELNISQDLADNLKVWDIAKVKIEWLNDLFNFEVFKIYPSKDELTKKVTIELFYNNIDNRIKLWSYSKIYFDLNKSSTWIIIPNTAIISKYMIPWVYVLSDNWLVSFKKIEIISQNDDITQVTWLNVWDMLITWWKDNIYDGEILSN